MYRPSCMQWIFQGMHYLDILLKAPPSSMQRKGHAFHAQDESDQPVDMHGMLQDVFRC